VGSIGRRWGLIQDVIIMFLGLCMLVASWGTTLQGWVICYAWSLFFYGIGVGGEVSTIRNMFPFEHLDQALLFQCLDRAIC
jgi:uncharacterized membrane protein YczE